MNGRGGLLINGVSRSGSACQMTQRSSSFAATNLNLQLTPVPLPASIFLALSAAPAHQPANPRCCLAASNFAVQTCDMRRTISASTVLHVADT
jgi:hypothetical protein